MMYRYKPEEGRNARQAAFWLGIGMVAFGATSLRGTLDRWESLRLPLFENFAEIPILGMVLNGSLVAALALFAVATLAWVRFLGAPKGADHLIEVEQEMKKVTWPSFREASNSSMVVIFTVLLLMGFMALADMVLTSLFKLVLWSTV